MEKGYSPQAVKIVVRAKCSVAFSLTPTLHLEGSILFHFLFVGSPKSFYWLLEKKWLKNNNFKLYDYFILYDYFTLTLKVAFLLLPSVAIAVIFIVFPLATFLVLTTPLALTVAYFALEDVHCNFLFAFS